MLGVALEGTELYNTVGECTSEEMIDTEVKTSVVVKPLPMSADEGEREDVDDKMVTSVTLLEVGRAIEVSLCGSGVDENCLVVEDVGIKTEVSDWPDSTVLIITVFDDVTVATFAWLLLLLPLPTVVMGSTPRLASDASTPPSVDEVPLPPISNVFVPSPTVGVGRTLSLWRAPATQES